jgi:hypothetical protein
MAFFGVTVLEPTSLIIAADYRVDFARLIDPLPVLLIALI